MSQSPTKTAARVGRSGSLPCAAGTKSPSCCWPATMLLDAGVSLTVRDPLLKSTPLGWACRWGRIELVRLYLERGADPVESNAEPWATPLAWATKRGHHEIIELLRSPGEGHEIPRESCRPFLVNSGLVLLKFDAAPEAIYPGSVFRQPIIPPTCSSSVS